MSKQRFVLTDVAGKALNAGDRVYIDKVGEGVVKRCFINFGTYVAEIKVPGATPDTELFDHKQLRFWGVRKIVSR